MEGLQGAKQVIEYLFSIKMPLGTTFTFTVWQIILAAFLVGLLFKLITVSSFGVDGGLKYKAGRHDKARRTKSKGNPEDITPEAWRRQNR